MDSTRETIRTCLIADVRGYTLFTQERGDEAAAKLAAKFARVVREAVERRDGSLIDLRGDEALVAFDSPRQAIRAAVELQERFVDETLAEQTASAVGSPRPSSLVSVWTDPRIASSRSCKVALH